MSCSPSTQFLALTEYRSQNWLDLSFDWLTWQSFYWSILVITPGRTRLDRVSPPLQTHNHQTSPASPPLSLSNGKLNWRNMKIRGIFTGPVDILTSLFWWLFWHLQIITNIDISDSAGFCTQHYSSYSPLLVTSDTRMIWYCVHCLQRDWKITFINLR